MNDFYRAHVDTRSFSFEAYGHSRSSSLVCLREGLFKHAVKYNIEPARQWVDEVSADANVTMYKLGVAYRDSIAIE